MCQKNIATFSETNSIKIDCYYNFNYIIVQIHFVMCLKNKIN